MATASQPGRSSETSRPGHRNRFSLQGANPCSRQLAAWITDNQGFSVSESTVYRILRREGLVKRAEMQLAAGKEYHRKTTGPHQMWATDASYFRVVGWGYYYMVTIMDDYSRFILAHRLQRSLIVEPL